MAATGIRTRASEETRALTWRIRPLGHISKYHIKYLLYLNSNYLIK